MTSRRDVARWGVALAMTLGLGSGAVGLIHALIDPSLLRSDEVQVIVESVGIPVEPVIGVGLVIPLAAMAGAGLLILLKGPREPMALGFALMLGTMGPYMTRSLIPLHAAYPATTLLVNAIYTLAFCSLYYVLFGFPNGRVSRSSAVAIGSLLIWLSFEPETYEDLVIRESIEDHLPLVLALVALFAWGLATQVARYRSQTSQEERLQIKWVVFPLIAALTYIVGVILPLSVLGTSETMFGALMLTAIPFVLAIPICVTRAVLKYKLYEIDVVVNKTLVYTALTTILVATYLALVVSMQTLFNDIADSQLVVAASTLAVAALFRPLEKRTQGFIDRRFYRSRYDAVRTLEAFSRRLRDEIELSVVTHDVENILGRTVQPAHAGIWFSHVGGPR